MPNTLLTSTHLYLIATISVMAGVGFFDFIIFLYLADVLNQVFFTNQDTVLMYYLQLIGLFIVGYVALPIGGFLIGRYGDIHGRKPVLTISILGVGIGTALIGLMPSSHQMGVIAPILFILLRMCQGVAFGGLLPVLWVFLTEHLPVRHLGFGCGCVMAGCLGAVFMAVVLTTSIENALTQVQMVVFGWRVPFLCGGIMACLLVIFVKKFMETPIFVCVQTPNCHQPNRPISAISFNDLTKQEIDSLWQFTNFDTKRNGQGHRQLSLKSLIKKGFLGVLLAVALSWLLASLVTMMILLPSLIDMSFALPSSFVYFGGIIGLLFMMIGCVFYGFLADRINAGKMMVVGSLFLLIQLPMFFSHLQSGGEFVLVFFALLGFASGLIAIAPVVLVRLFPAKMRLAGVAVSYNFTYACVAGVLPFALGYAVFNITFAPILYLMLVMLATLFSGFYVYYLPRAEQDMNR